MTLITRAVGPFKVLKSYSIRHSNCRSLWKMNLNCHPKRQQTIWLYRNWLKRATTPLAIHQTHVNAITMRNEDFGISNSTRNTIATWNAYRIIHGLNADAYHFHCFVRSTNRLCVGCNLNLFIFSGGRGTKVCGPKKEKCYMRAEKYFFGSDDKTDCNCLPSCVSIAYDAYSSTGDYDLVSAYSKSIFQSNFNLTR